MRKKQKQEEEGKAGFRSAGKRETGRLQEGDENSHCACLENRFFGKIAADVVSYIEFGMNLQLRRECARSVEANSSNLGLLQGDLKG
jgi:hypothetical protein